MKAEVIAIGSELTSGQSLDTNSQWLSQRLGELGADVRYHTTLADDLSENVEALRVARSRVRLVVLTGGLGPTQDDLTREALGTLANVPLVEDEESLRDLLAYFERRNRVMAARNRVQVLLPEGSQALRNRVGTAPGMWLETEGVIFAALPGVPHEMKVMFDEQVAPRLKATGRLGRVRANRVIHLFGRGESEIEADALDLTARGRVPEVGITASDATISFRITTEGETLAAAQTAAEPTARLIYDRFGPLIIGEGSTDVTSALFAELEAHNATIALAESCTGGLIAKSLTDFAGSSRILQGGVVCYSNASKVYMLGVPPDVLEREGAVSAPVAEAIALGARSRFQATIGLGVTGIAGPGGGSDQKPVGLVYLGLATEKGVAHRKLLLGSDQPRHVIRSRSARYAMNWARLFLKTGELE